MLAIIKINEKGHTIGTDIFQKVQRNLIDTHTNYKTHILRVASPTTYAMHGHDVAVAYYGCGYIAQVIP
jgi:hypothetical protein